jgi:hypothetical protein
MSTTDTDRSSGWDLRAAWDVVEKVTGSRTGAAAREWLKEQEEASA